MHRHFRSARVGATILSVLATFVAASDARAQSASTSRPLPDVLLLVDNSGSMENKPDNTLPTCLRGDVNSEINRWGMLLQALTGNIQPFFSCGKVLRTAGSNFAKRYSINGVAPYDTGYYLPFDQPTSGETVDACAVTPFRLPGAAAGNGVGQSKLGYGAGLGSKATDFPDDAITSYKFDALGVGFTSTTIAAGDTNKCDFEQTNDGQLDAAANYARFALMTFDNATEPQTGLSGSAPSFTIDTAYPFLGMWSYLRSTGNTWQTSTSDIGAASTPSAPPALAPLYTGHGAQGNPNVPGCVAGFNEIGARNPGAPPWEGRLVHFPLPDASIYDINAQNAQLQRVLLASRPYGATPIDGMMDDARDYFWNYDDGAVGIGKSIAPKRDTYLCRDKYIILLTDGAPNLNLRPDCGVGAGTGAGICPYPEDAGTIADSMYTATAYDKHVTTYVIGFSVNGVATSPIPNDGFPAALTGTDRNCKTWFDQATVGAADEKDAATKMKMACGALSPPDGPIGSTANACCQLNAIALQGGAMGAFFAESQADVVLSFGRIMANIIHSASTKTIPAFSPATSYSASAFVNASSTTSSAGQFIASYVPSTQTPWAGEIDRTRYMCDGLNKSSVPVTGGEDATKGDFMSENLAKQAGAKKRLVISVLGEKMGASIDSGASIRPFVAASTTSALTGVDNIGKPGISGTSYSGKEVAMTNYAPLLPDADWPLAMNITDKTCKRGRAVRAGAGALRGTDIIPSLTAANCTNVVWGFTVATPDPQPIAGVPALPMLHDFNVRCKGGGTVTSGFCSITGNTCTPGAASGCATGEVCIPKCAALGGIFHSNPVVIPPPQSLIREEGFRQYQQNRATRRSVLYAASVDGMMHAFKALDEGDPATVLFELWAFVPPAALPKMAANYPAGNQILLDGAPVVRETVWDRAANTSSVSKDWHTTLVAGLGTTGGYYALNVTDADCGGTGVPGGCLSNYGAPGTGLAQVSTNGDTTDTSYKKGPHFLWQLADIPADTGSAETGKVYRKSTIGSADMVALFGRNTGTPAIGVVQIKTGATERQVGIAILPGGYDDPPVVNAFCPRRNKVAADVYNDLPYRGSVRQWSKAGCSAPVPGRNVTIVRLDTGEVIRVFGRIQDTPNLLKPKLAGPVGVTETLFDSPMVGTPVVYPDQPGVPIQKAFIGDADGTLWRLDFTSSDPKNWRANLFEDLIVATAAPAGQGEADLSQPIQVPPVLSLTDAGDLIVNAATGDQENLVANSDKNYVYSILEHRDYKKPAQAEALWYQTLSNSERVTGPMTVFDRTLYFASYLPERPASGTSSCNGLGKAFLWGLNYAVSQLGTVASGGKFGWCPEGSVVGGVCTVPSSSYVANGPSGTDVIPGVTLQASQACVTAGGNDEYGNSTFGTVSTTQYNLSFGIAKPNGAGTPPQAARRSVARQLPRVSTKIDSWSIVVE